MGTRSEIAFHQVRKTRSEIAFHRARRSRSTYPQNAQGYHV